MTQMLINLTPHVIHLPGMFIEPSGLAPRCTEVSAPRGSFAGVELIAREYGQVESMPAPVEDVLYIVSLLVRQALPDRKDIASPGDLIRDESGKIIGAQNLVVNF